MLEEKNVYNDINRSRLKYYIIALIKNKYKDNDISLKIGKYRVNFNWYKNIIGKCN